MTWPFDETRNPILRFGAKMLTAARGADVAIGLSIIGNSDER